VKQGSSGCLTKRTRFVVHDAPSPIRKQSPLDSRSRARIALMSFKAAFHLVHPT
jgi:hypothetical protein